MGALRARIVVARARHPWAPSAAAGLLLGLAALKMVRPDEPELAGHARRSLMLLCEDPWLVPNALMFIGELAAGLTLFTRAGRAAGAMIGVTVMSCAALYSLYAGIAHIDLTSCGCFGPFEAPWWMHLLVASTVGTVSAAALSDAPCPPSARGCRTIPRSHARAARTRSKQ